MKGRAVLALLLGLTVAPTATALDDTAGLHFSHHDWELACDNTRTCRAAGYSPEDSSGPAVSVLLTREAGPDQPVQAEVQMYVAGDGTSTGGVLLEMLVDGRSQGETRLDNDRGALSVAQARKLIAAAVGTGRVEFRDGEYVARLSNKGATAVLLKMDEAQGRVGTRGALVRPGAAGESRVLPARPMPVVRAVATSDKVVELPASELSRLRKELLAEVDLEECDRLREEIDASVSDTPKLRIVELSHGHRLASAACWSGAYNAGSVYWVIRDQPPYRPQHITANANEYEAGELRAILKGRGLGDCWSSETWTWDGTTFVSSGALSSGQCRGIPGGLWTFPTRVSEVR